MGINEFITERYERWRGYATFLCRRSGFPFDPTEVLNHALHAMLEKSLEEQSRLIASESGGMTEFDYLLRHIIRRNIYSPRSTFRYVSGPSYRCETDLNTLPWQDEDTAESDAETECRRRLVIDTVKTLPIASRFKEIFLWRFEQGRPYSEWPGNENKKRLNTVYSRIFLMISSKLRGKKRV